MEVEELLERQADGEGDRVGTANEPLPLRDTVTVTDLDTLGEEEKDRESVAEALLVMGEGEMVVVGELLRVGLRDWEGEVE